MATEIANDPTRSLKSERLNTVNGAHPGENPGLLHVTGKIHTRTNQGLTPCGDAEPCLIR